MGCHFKSRRRGQGLIQTAGLVFIMLVIGGLSIDTALYLAAHKGEQNAADAAALAAASVLFKDTSSTQNVSTRLTNARTVAKSLSQQNMNNRLNDADIEFGYVDPVTGAYNANTFTNPTLNANFAQTGGYNAVRVTVKAAAGQANSPIPAIFNQYLGINSYNSYAQAVSIYGGGATSLGGLRPFYLCESAWTTAKTLHGDATIPIIKFYGSTLEINGVPAASTCGAMPAGNWGFADFGQGNSVPALANVITNGWSGTVSVNTNQGATPGNKINSSHVRNAIQSLITNQTIITIPLYDVSTQTGNNAQFHITQFVGFQVTDYQANGNNSYIEGYFKKVVCNTNCTTSSATQGGAVTKLRLVR